VAPPLPPSGTDGGAGPGAGSRAISSSPLERGLTEE
jgi:hypothetical protein